MHRVQELSRGKAQPDGEERRPFTKLAPLIELLAYTKGKDRAAKSVGLFYHRICTELGGEVRVLTQVGYGDLERVGGENLANIVTNVRNGQVEIVPGFDGQWGRCTRRID